MDSSIVDYYEHPVLHPIDLHLKTPPMEQLTNTIKQWLWTGSTGGVVSGESRMGKTHAALDLENKLYTRGKTLIPFFYMAIPPRDAHTIKMVYRELCLREKLRVVKTDGADHLSDRYVHYIADRCVEANCRQAVQIIDEMQRLIPEQFNALAELYDKLLLLGISLTVVFVGNDPQCWELVKIIEGKRYAHIHGRFFRQGCSFFGLKSKNEVRKCLSQYDNLRFPDKGPTYTEYFLPNAVKNGWKLSSLSEDIWRVFRDYQKLYQINSWGMQYFTVTINTLLSDFLPQYGINDIDDDIIKECIELSGIIPSLVRPIK